jgi:sigma-B regulation protein RsbU (phosphoserine phosphatase)
MSGTTDPFSVLRLDPIEGPEIAPLAIEPGRATVVGRSSTCDAQLPDPGVSRQHASISRKGSIWFITDAGSRQGTLLNSQRLNAEAPTPLRDGDLVRIAPWTFRVRCGGPAAMSTIITDDGRGAPQRVERLAPEAVASLTRQRLDLLIECSAAINTAATEEAMAAFVLDAAVKGTGYSRCSLIRPLHGEEEVQIIGHLGPSGTSATGVAFARSLLRAASSGQPARLAADSDVPQTHSIISLGITAALCAPIMLGSTVAAYLYLDARGAESRAKPDAEAFCMAIARLCGLAMANLKRVELEGRHKQLEHDLLAARQAQELIVPATDGAIGPFRYAVQMRPGRLVAGDLFDVVPLEDGRVGLFIGDVAGEGVGAAILMAFAQAHLHAALLRYGDPGAALTSVNRQIAHRTASGKFISMWAGVFDPARSTLAFADAGHGHWAYKPIDGPLTKPKGGEALLVGIDPDVQYTSATIPVRPGDRVVLYSDGVVEQDAPGGDRFGRARVLEVLDASNSSAEDVSSLFTAVLAFAGTADLADDTTVASIEVGNG